MGFNGIYATYCVFRRKSPILKKFLQCIILQPEYCRSYNMYTPSPNILQSFLHIYALLTPRSVCRQRSVASDSADGGVSLPYSASGKLPRPCSANGRYRIAQPVARPTACHSEPPRMRRVEESTCAAAKRLLCNHARVPTHKLYCSPASSFDFEPRFSLGSPLRMAERAA